MKVSTIILASNNVAFNRTSKTKTKHLLSFRMLYADAWTAEDQNYLNPPTPKRKSVHTPFREEDAVFKIPLAPSPKSSPNPKSSIFTKLSPRPEPKPIRENGTLQPPLSNNVFGKSAFSDVMPSNNIFQSSNNKQSTQPSSNIFGLPSIQNVFQSAKSSNENLFKLANQTNATDRIFGNSTSSSGIFSNLGGITSSTNQMLPNESVKINSNSREATKKIESDELKQLERQKEKIEMEIRKEEEAERLRKEEMEKEQLRRQKETQERIENERKEKERREKERVDALKRIQRIEQLSEATVAELLNEFVHEESEVIAKNALEVYHQIESATEDIYYELLAEIIFEESVDWERVYHEKIETIESTPIWLPDKSSLEVVPELMHPLQDETLNMSKRYRQGAPRTLKCPELNENMIDIFEIVPQQLNKTRTAMERIQKRTTFWKCGVSIPNAMEDKSCQRIEKWLDKLFLRREPIDPKIFFCERQFVRSVDQEFAISMRKFHGSELSKEDGSVDVSDINGLNAIVLIMSASNPKETKKRLQNLLKYKSVDCVIGVVMLNVHKNQESYLRSELQLTENSEFLIKYFCMKEDATSSLLARNRQLIKCLKWAAANFKFKNSLEMQTTTSFFDQCLGNQFWHRILTSSASNPGLFKAACNIAFIIDTYNTALDYLDDLVTEDFSNHPIFPHEFKRFVKTMSNDIPLNYQYFSSDWKDPNRSKQLHNFVISLRLQPVSLRTSSLEEIQEQLLAYAHRHIADKVRSDRAAYRMIKVLLEYLAANDGQSFQQQITSFNWIDSVRLLTLEILLFQYEKKKQHVPEVVIYNREKFKQYLNNPWWLMANSPMNQVRLSFDRQEEDDEPFQKKSRPNPIDKDEIEKLIARGADALEKADAKINKFKTTISVGRQITQDLDSILYEHERNLRVQKRWSQLQIND